MKKAKFSPTCGGRSSGELDHKRQSDKQIMQFPVLIKRKGKREEKRRGVR